MEEEEANNNGLYLLLVALILIGIGLAYSRVPAFRHVVNDKAPWFKEKVGHYLVSSPDGDDQKGADGAYPSNGSQSFDFATFSAHPEIWPQSIAIKTATQFPAVVNGKPVGSLTVPAGSEVHLLKAENGKLGVEYQGGGAWVAPEATDLVARLRASSSLHP